MLRAVLLLSSCAFVAAGKAEFSSSNLRSGVGLDSIKASLDKTVVVGGHSTKLSATYDFKAKKKFLSCVALSGAVSPPPAPYVGKFKVGYDLSHSFKSNMQALKLSVAAKGATLKAAVDAKGAKLTEVASASKFNVLSIKPSYKPPSKLIELKLEAYGAAATLGYKANGGSLAYKLEASQEIADGREIEAELGAEGVELSLSDSTVEQGATWTATLSTPFSSPLSGSELVVRRSMAF